MATEQTTELSKESRIHTGNRAVTELAIGGMTCGNCARHVTEAIQSVPGVRGATVSLDVHQASVRWGVDVEPNVPAVIKAVKEAGYEANVAEVHPHEHGEHKLAGWQVNLWIGVLGTAPLMIGEWVFGLALERWFQWFSFVLASLVQVFAGARFYRGAWGQLKAGSSNMDTLVALGSSSAFAYSAWALLSGVGGHVYFMEAASIITLVSVGHWMEARVSVRASSALQRLLNLAPALAHRRNADGTASEVPVAELKPADLAVLHPGDRVPTDGEVVEGDSAVDESMLTGESAPVDKTARSQLYAGTVNLNGLLVMRITAVGDETALAHIIEAVQRAQTSRANIQRLGDRVSSVFVPVVVTVALAAALWWGLAPESANHIHTWLARFLWPAHPPQGPLAAAFIIASAVLIIACPCAMGLATPAAIMAGSNAAAQRGILVRDGMALEKAGKVTVVLFDKTGTLTMGKPSVVKVWEAPGARSQRSESDQSSVLSLAAALARHSTHPVSQAVANLSREGLEVKDWEEIRGAGVRGIVHSPESGVQGPDEEHSARLGSLRWLQESGVDLAEGETFIQEWSGQGATIVGLAMDKSLRGLFAVKDTVKPGAGEVVGQIHRQGLKTYLVTGDNLRTATSIAKRVGIPPEHVFAEVRPEQKAELVKKLQQQGERVAFVGDGINDAPALEQADLGIAVSRASDIAREAADIILLKSEIEAVPESLGLARATLRTIKQNLFWAFLYNAIGVPLAALGFMSPILCAAAMGLSDLVVIGNALRLRRWRL
jgi:P-type Cu+ transporter